jgi:hypothetical protein
MSGIQRLVAVVAASLLVPIPCWAKPEVIGVVTQATHASLGTYGVSAGSSVFDGDKLSTGTGGDLQLRSGKATFYLKEESSALLRRKTGSEGEILEGELFAGELIVSSVEGAATEILACHVRVRLQATVPAIVQVRILDPKTLNIFARRGAARVFYRGEEALIAEGQSYRMELDPRDDGSSADEKNKKTQKKRRVFILVAIGVMAGSMGPWLWKAYESPDRP